MIEKIENLRYISIYLSLIPLFFSFLNFKKIPTYKSKFIVLSIFLTSVIELFGKQFTEWTGIINFYLYNFYIYTLFIIYFIILISLFNNIRYKIISIISMIIFTLSFLYNLIYKYNIIDKGVYKDTYFLAVIIFTILSSIYLIQIFNSNNILNIKKSIFFWFILGVLLFHLPFLPFMLCLEYFLIEFHSSIYWIIIFILNLIMNSCFIIGFVWTEKKYNY